MELRQLRSFLAVIECGSFSRAAEKIGVTQQAISRNILTLESAVGAQLVERDKRVACPTPLGKVLVMYANNILAEADGFQRKVEDMLAASGGRVRLGSSLTAAIELVSEAVLSLNRDRDDIRLDVIAGALPAAADALMHGEMDLFVGIDNGAGDYEGLEREVFATELYCVVAGKQHPLAHAAHVSAQDLCDSEWIIGKHLGLVEAGWRAAYTSRGLDCPTPKITTTSLDFCKNILMSSPFLSVLPRQLVGSEIENGNLSCLNLDGFSWERPIALFYRRNTTFNDAISSTIEALRQAAGKYRRLLACQPVG